jgi:hypothetical protein
MVKATATSACAILVCLLAIMADHAEAQSRRAVLIQPPSGLQATAVDPESVDLGWTGSDGATGYVVYRGLGTEGPWTQITPSPITATTYRDSGLRAETTYGYYVVAVGGRGSAKSETVTVTTPTPILNPLLDRTGPILEVRVNEGAPPTDVSARALGPTSALLDWTPPSGAASLIVHRGPSPDGPWIALAAVPGSATGYTDQRLGPSITAHYKVAADYGTRTLPGISLPVSVTTPRLVPTGTLTATQAGPGAAQVTWEPMKGAKAYQLAVSDNTRKLALNETPTVSGTSHTFSGLEVGLYAFTVVGQFDVDGIGTTYSSMEYFTEAVILGLRGRYALYLDSLFVVKPTYDDATQWDGKGDEIYLDFAQTLLDDTGTNVACTTCPRIPEFGSMGDVSADGVSHRAGSLQPNGGITAGDGIGFGSRLLWCGDLGGTEKKTAVITPTIWEADQDVEGFKAFLRWVEKSHQELKNTEVRESIGVVCPTCAAYMYAGAVTNEYLARHALYFIEEAGSAVDRPIGLNAERKFIPTPVVLTYEGVEHSILQPRFGLGPGRLKVDFKEPLGVRLDGHYTMFLHVDRVGQCPARP